MARPNTNFAGKRQQIIEAALQTFATHGYEGTTNKLIAQEAGDISPSLIYHYFPEGKQQLFQAVLAQLPPLQTLTAELQKNQNAAPEQFLRNIGRTYLDLLHQETMMNIVRIIMVEAPRQPNLAAAILAQLGPTIILPLVAYLQKQMAQGYFRQMPPMAGPMLFLGPLLTRSLIVGAIGTQAAPLPIISEEEMLENVVQTFLYGVLDKPPIKERAAR